ncbi:MAG: hypothetical protein M1838_003784 [Thelocarpon superellum]|nr:MAG: hypothetical protein M1838_003784 [Thelocarpon superellum]
MPSTKKRKRAGPAPEKESTPIPKQDKELSQPSQSDRQIHPARPTTHRKEAAIDWRRSKEKNKGRRAATAGANTWTISEATAGRFIDASPVFSLDERFLLLAQASAVHVYAIQTSSLARTLALPAAASADSAITDHALSRTNPHHLYACTLDGIVHKWDWVAGTKLGRWQLASKVVGIVIGTVRSGQTETDVVYAREQDGSKWCISAHKLTSGADASQTESKTIRRSEQPITALKALVGGRILVAASGERLLVGTSPEGVASPLRETKVLWREIRTSDWITSLDVQLSGRVLDAPSTKRKPVALELEDPVIDVIVGHFKGPIFVYEDLLHRWIGAERDREGFAQLLEPRKHHWHREAVRSLCWSLDGNYVISGGSETVLVLWQLDTRRLQTLPHLSSSIERIVVSPTGASYAIRLADNSAMVISTTELKPTAYIAGIQSYQWTGPHRLQSGHIRNLSSSRQSQATASWQRWPMTISPLAPNQLLLAAASSAKLPSPTDSAFGAPYLQVFDFYDVRHLHRQALARTNTTNRNTGPDSYPIGEPTVTLIQISADGRWLVSVDEWTPPSHDLDFLTLDGPDLRRWQRQRREVFLKFWTWDEGKREWILVTRVDAPHGRHPYTTARSRVLDLCAHPSQLSFATGGDDQTVRIWKGQKRTRNDLVVRGSDATILTSWACTHVINLGMSSLLPVAGDTDAIGSDKSSVHLASSADGSVLAVVHRDVSSGPGDVVSFIDPGRGEVTRTRRGLVQGPAIALAFLDRYLVILAEQLVVWNVVEDVVLYSLLLRASPMSTQMRTPLTHLAVDSRHGTFTVALPATAPGKGEHLTQERAPNESLSKVYTQVIICDPTNPVPLCAIPLPRAVTALMHAPGTKNFVMVDTEGELRIIRPSSGPHLPTTKAPVSSADGLVPTRPASTVATLDAVDVADAGEESEESDGAAREPCRPRPAAWAEVHGAMTDDRDDVPVVRTEQLSEIFDVGPAYAMPPIEDLYDQVMGLYAGTIPTIE